MITVFRALVRKDIRLFLNDRRAVLMSVCSTDLVSVFMPTSAIITVTHSATAR